MPRRPGPPSPAQLSTTALPTVHLARDHPRELVAHHVRSGTWTPARRGAYVALPRELDGPTRRRRLAMAQVVAAAEQLQLDHTVSHESAALVWGLPLLRPPTHVHLIQAVNASNHGATDIVRHGHRLPADQRTEHRGMPVTTLERTVVDCTMALDPHAGLVIADAALHIGADRERCQAILETMVGRRGVRTAREVLDLADGGAESAGESSARFVLLRAGLPVPETQVAVDTHLGTFWSDLGWREWRLLAEYDGRVKYAANGSAPDAVIREKRRQDAIEDERWRMIRLTTEDVAHPAALLRRIARLAPGGALDARRPRPLLNTNR